VLSPMMSTGRNSSKIRALSVTGREGTQTPSGVLRLAYKPDQSKRENVPIALEESPAPVPM
jgi:hypothetical protein